jgi:hypothetical protein
MKTAQKGFILPLLIVLLGVVLVGGAYYVYEHGHAVSPSVPAIRNSISTTGSNTALSNTKPGYIPSQTATTTGSTAGWQTYNNAQYGISFMYPAGWDQPIFSDLNAYGVDQKQLLFSKQQLFITWGETLNGKVQTIDDYTNLLVNGSGRVSDSSFQKGIIAINGENYITLSSNNAVFNATTNDLSVLIPESSSPDSGFADVDYTTCSGSSDCTKIAHSDVDGNTFNLIVGSFKFAKN